MSSSEILRKYANLVEGKQWASQFDAPKEEADAENELEEADEDAGGHRRLPGADQPLPRRSRGARRAIPARLRAVPREPDRQLQRADYPQPARDPTRHS